MKLNLGCGFSQKEGWVNVDSQPDCNPDQIWDLEKTPWPWESNSVDEILMNHVLEHLGAETSVYLGIIREMYRVCRDGAQITIAVPHPRHDNFMTDPTHVRPITPEGLMMFSQEQNLRDEHVPNTPLGIYLDVDFNVDKVEVMWAEPWRSRITTRAKEKQALDDALIHNNMIEQYKIWMRAIKPSATQKKKIAGAGQIG